MKILIIVLVLLSFGCKPADKPNDTIIKAGIYNLNVDNYCSIKHIKGFMCIVCKDDWRSLSMSCDFSNEPKG